MRRIVAALLVATNLLWAEAAAARDDVPAALADARRCYEEARFEDAVSVLEGVLERDDASDEEELRAHELLGATLVALGRTQEAREHYLVLLERDPGARLPEDTSPKIVGFFEALRREHAAAAAKAAPAPAPPAAPEERAAPAPRPRVVEVEPRPATAAEARGRLAEERAEAGFPPAVLWGGTVVAAAIVVTGAAVWTAIALSPQPPASSLGVRRLP